MQTNRPFIASPRKQKRPPKGDAKPSEIPRVTAQTSITQVVKTVECIWCLWSRAACETLPATNPLICGTGHVLLKSQFLAQARAVFFRTIRRTFPPQIWEEDGGASYSLNVASLAGCGCGRDGGVAAVEQGPRRQEQDHIFCFNFFFKFIFLL